MCGNDCSFGCLLTRCAVGFRFAVPCCVSPVQLDGAVASAGCSCLSIVCMFFITGSAPFLGTQRSGASPSVLTPQPARRWPHTEGLSARVQQWQRATSRGPGDSGQLPVQPSKGGARCCQLLGGAARAQFGGRSLLLHRDVRLPDERVRHGDREV